MKLWAFILMLFMICQLIFGLLYTLKLIDWNIFIIFLPGILSIFIFIGLCGRVYWNGIKEGYEE